MHNIRKITAYILIFILTISLFQPVVVNAEGTSGVPAVPQNVAWDSSAYARATWNAAANADYYYVNVYITCNGKEILDDMTGTNQNYVDLQGFVNQCKEWYQMINSDTVNIRFRVCSSILGKNGEGDTNSEWSEWSEYKEFKILDKEKLRTPDDIVFCVENGQYLLKWTPSEHANVYSLKIYVNDTEYPWPGISTEGHSIVDDKAIMDVTNQIRMIYLENNYSGKTVSIACSLQACCVDFQDPEYTDYLYYLPSDYSEKTNPLSYYNDVKKFDTIKDLSLSLDKDQQQLLLEFPFNKDADRYAVIFKVNGEQIECKEYICELQYNSDYTIVGDNIRVNLFNYFATTIYREIGYDIDNVSVSCAVSARNKQYGELDYNYSEFSAWSNEIVFDYQFERLNKPTNVNVSDKYILSWDNYDNKAEDYWIKIYGYIGNTKIDYISHDEFFYLKNYTVSGNTASIDVSEKLFNAYKGLTTTEDPLTMEVEIYARGNLEKGYVDSQQESSNCFILNPYNKVLVEQVLLSPKKMVMAEGRNYYLGVSVLPVNASYLDTRWSNDNEICVGVGEHGYVYGIEPGQAIVTASIGLASDTSNIIVYHIDSEINDDIIPDNNIVDSDFLNNVMNANVYTNNSIDIINLVGDTIDGIGNDVEDFDLTHVDVDEKDRATVKELILDKLKKDTSVAVSSDIEIIKTDVADLYFDINLPIKIINQNTNEETLVCNIIKLDNPIWIKLNSSAFSKDISEYDIYSIDNNQEKKLEKRINDDGSISVKTDILSNLFIKGIAEDNIDNIVVIKQKTDIHTLVDIIVTADGVKGVYYKIEDKNERKKASINKKGIITPKKEGNVNISVFNDKACTDRISIVPILVVKPNFNKTVMQGYYPKQVVSGNLILQNYEILNRLTKANQTIEWSSSNSKVATIDNNGNITVGDKSGKTKIILQITNKEGKKVKYSCVFKVKVPKLVKDNLKLKNGKTKQLKLKNLSKGNTVTWISENPDIAEVNDAGVVTAKTVGTTNIKAIVNGVEYICKIDVL